jgi:hypothetical protein
MMAIEFVKHIDKFSLKNKTRILCWFAIADIDPSYIIKTAHKLCASYVEAFAYKGSEDEIPKLGLFTD